MTNYVFSVSPIPPRRLGGPRSARAIIEEREKSGRWPLNGGTLFQSVLTAGDRAIIYVSAKDPQGPSFIATCEIAGPRFVSDRLKVQYPYASSTALPVVYDVPIQNMQWFEEPVPIRSILESLSFVKDTSSWGAYLQGGVKRLAEGDVELILSRSGLAP